MNTAMMAINVENSLVVDQVGQWIGFRLGGQHYAVPVDQVQEVIRPRDIAAVPGAPGIVLGLMNLRGRLLPVIDGRRRLGLRSQSISLAHAQRVLVLATEEEQVGMLVEAVEDMVQIDTSEVLAPPTSGARRSNDPVVGVVRGAHGFTALLDVGKLCNPEA